MVAPLIKMENKYSKPGFDGRLKYYEHLKSYWDRLADASFDNDYPNWKKALRGYFARTRSFIKTEDTETIKTLFDNVNNMIDVVGSFDNNNKQIVINQIIKKLQEIEDSLFVATKDMLVSTKDDEEETFDEEKFMRDSD